MADGPDKVTDVSQTSNGRYVERGSETAGDKLRGREGNSPEHRLRPPKRALSGKGLWDRGDNQEVGLEAAILERVRNSSLVKWVPRR